jgi:hypothetical protein
VDDLLLEIARCPIVEHCKADRQSKHPCAEIVWSQPQESLAAQQVPMPWSGHLEQAPILFLSSNPSIDLREDHACWHWSDDEISDFFTNRFGGGRKEWIRDGRYRPLVDGAYSKRPVPFWSAVRRRAAELMDVPVADIQPGIHYSISAVVHCKSQSEEGVKEAFKTCVARYLYRVVAQSAARIIVGLGTHAAHAVRQTFNSPQGLNVYGPIPVGEHERIFAFLPHPSAFMPKTFAARITPEELGRLRLFLKPHAESHGTGD